MDFKRTTTKNRHILVVFFSYVIFMLYFKILMLVLSSTAIGGYVEKMMIDCIIQIYTVANENNNSHKY